MLATIEVSPVEDETEMALPEPSVEPPPADAPVVRAPPVEPAPPADIESKPPTWDVFGFEGQLLPVVDVKGSATTVCSRTSGGGCAAPCVLE